MSTLEEYGSGSILDGITRALLVIDTIGGSLAVDPVLQHVQEKILEFRPRVVTLDTASVHIREASVVALGTRVCLALHPGSPATDSVFVDDLAVTMINAGKARPASPEEAITTLRSHNGHPLVMSMVSGKYLEICASHRQDCVFWRAEQHGIRCFERG
jgi:hypothetical protein